MKIFQSDDGRKSNKYMPKEGDIAPDFVLKDINGKNKRLHSYRGKIVILYFFCGCNSCHDVASEWAVFQRDGTLFSLFKTRGSRKSKEVTKGINMFASSSVNMPITIIAYIGLENELKRLSRDTGLYVEQTLLLIDADMKVASETYHSEPCPRVFVLDGNGHIRYVNNSKSDEPQKAPAKAITSRVIGALRRLSSTNP